MILRGFLSDSEKLAQLSADISEYAKKMYHDDAFLKSLQAEYKKNEKEISNVVKAIKSGRTNQILLDVLDELEIKRGALSDAIEAERIKLSLAEDNISITHYFEMFAEADFEDAETRDKIFEYFIDKI